VLIGGSVVAAAIGVGGWMIGRGRMRGHQLGPVFADARPGTRVGPCTIVAVHPLHFGAVPIVLETSAGRRYQVDVLARDPGGPDGVASTSRLSLFVANGGNGRTDTDEEQGLGVMALGDLLGASDRSGVELPALLTMQQRRASHSDGAYGVPLT
jgi:hypothetical protein